MSIEIDNDDQEQLDQLLEKRKQISASIAQIEMQKKQLDEQKDNLLEQWEQIANNLNNKMSEIKRVYDVDGEYNYDRVSGELVESGD